jgi:3-deoxy-D-manno-octulosonic-acid transferase
MDRMIEHASPKVIVLLETEIWPGLLAAAKKMDVPVVVVNGRMTSGSLAGYLLFEGLLKEIGPERILATSPESASRFSLVFGAGRVEPMANMKFDALGAAPEADNKENPLSEIIKPGAPFVVMGSVRKEEESEALYALELLLEAKPKTIIGLFPRHMHRLESWKNMLAGAGLTWRLRSELSGPAPQGGVILWDTFGELAHAYAHARAAFVGGTLRPLGGQNFLEPLAYGLTPVIGPFYSNFAWVGEGLFENKLVKRVETARDVAEALAKSLEQRQSREKVKQMVNDFAAEHSGGTRQAAELIRRYL